MKNSKLLDKIVILAFKIYFKQCSNYMKLMKLNVCFVLFVFVLCLWSNVSCFSGLSILDWPFGILICYYFTRIPVKIKKNQNEDWKLLKLEQKFVQWKLNLKFNFRPILWKPVSHQHKHVKMKIKYCAIYSGRTTTSFTKEKH